VGGCVASARSRVSGGDLNPDTRGALVSSRLAVVYVMCASVCVGTHMAHVRDAHGAAGPGPGSCSHAYGLVTSQVELNPDKTSTCRFERSRIHDPDSSARRLRGGEEGRVEFWARPPVARCHSPPIIRQWLQRLRIWLLRNEWSARRAPRGIGRAGRTDDGACAPGSAATTRCEQRAMRVFPLQTHHAVTGAGAVAR
jgi:hypothetical protein